MIVETIPGLTRSEVARRLGVSPVRVDQLRDEGRLPYRRCALGRLYDAADVEQLRREREGAQHEK